MDALHFPEPPPNLDPGGGFLSRRITDLVADGLVRGQDGAYGWAAGGPRDDVGQSG